MFELDSTEAAKVGALVRKIQKACRGENGLRVARACLSLTVATFKVTQVDPAAAHALLDEAFASVEAGTGRAPADEAGSK